MRYFLYHGQTDMRKSFDGLCGLVTNEMHQVVISGDVFIFLNKRKTHIKLLVWEGDGFAIYYKRLEEGTYEFPDGSSPEKSLPLSYTQLMLILQGVSLKKKSLPEAISENPKVIHSRTHLRIVGEQFGKLTVSPVEPKIKKEGGFILIFTV